MSEENQEETIFRKQIDAKHPNFVDESWRDKSVTNAPVNFVQVGLDATSQKGIVGPTVTDVGETVSNDSGSFTMPDPDPALESVKHVLWNIQTPGFQLLSLPLTGGMGAVYKAWNLELERVVALKLSTCIKRSEDSQEAEDQQLRVEAANLARIEHPSIAGCHGYGRFEHLAYFEMQWVDGVSLDQLINFLFEAGLQNAIETGQLQKWMCALVDALIYCQLRGIHHLDLKPKNLMLSPKRRLASQDDPVALAILQRNFEEVNEQQIKDWCHLQEIRILDFGLARRSDESDTISTGSGTPAWMAPEQVCNIPADPALIDQYGIGGVTYACLTGNSPNRSETVKFKEARANKNASEFCIRARPREINSNIDRDLEAIVLKCLDLDSERRYQTLDELREDIVGSQNLRPIKARKTNTVERAIRYVRRHPFIVSTISILTVGICTTLVLLMSLAAANKEVFLAHKSDQATFQQAINAVSTMDRLYLDDPQLNRPENRELATRFKATLFDLYQLLASRNGIEIADRRHLADVSHRLAMEQKQRGDYELAAKFFEVTVNQYRSLLQHESMADFVFNDLCIAMGDLLESQALVRREIFPTSAILKQSEALIAETRASFSKPMILFAISNHCYLRLILEGRNAAKDSEDLLSEGVELFAQISPRDNQEQLLKAQSMLRIALVSYKGGLGSHRECFDNSLSLFKELAESQPDDTHLNLEYASALNTATMPKVTMLDHLGRARSAAKKFPELTPEALKLIEEIDNNYSTAASLINSALHADPLNNEFQRSKISSQWMVADFYRVRRRADPHWNLEFEIEMRDQCIKTIKEMMKSQPSSASAKHALTLQLYRKSLCHRQLNRNDIELECIAELIAVDGWSKLARFEIPDMVGLILAILENLRDSDELLGLQPVHLEEAMMATVSQLREFCEAQDKKYPADKSLTGRPIDFNLLNNLSRDFSEVQPTLVEFLALLDRSATN